LRTWKFHQWAYGEDDLLGVHIPEMSNDLATINFDRKCSKIDRILKPLRGETPVHLRVNYPDIALYIQCLQRVVILLDLFHI
jgi:hypothetical protein